MKNKSIKFTSSYFFQQRKRFTFSGKKDSSEHLPEVVKPASVIEDILRWADDGGQMLPLYSQDNPSTSPESSEYRVNQGIEDNDKSDMVKG